MAVTFFNRFFNRVTFALSFGLLSGAAALLIGAPSALAGKEERRITLKVVYKAERGAACPSGKPTMQPLPGAHVKVEFAGRKEERRLNEAGKSEIPLKGKGKQIRAEVTLEDPDVSVTRWGNNNAYSFKEELKLGHKRTYVLRLDDPSSSGAGSTWSILHKGARFAKKTVPKGVGLAQVPARYQRGRRTPKGGSSYNGSEILVDSAPTRPNEFESWILLHEYAHHLLYGVADPGPGAGGEHDADRSYRNRPAMAWDEGFAHAYAAIVRQSPVLGTRCQTKVNIGKRPAVPRSKDGPRWNQYHELSVAGAVWGLVTQLGKRNRQAGLKRLLKALHAFHIHKKYGGPESLREVRDALSVAKLEKSAKQHQRFTELFADHYVGWGFSVEVDSGEGEYAEDLDYVDMKLTGPPPYGTCQANGTSSGPAGGAPFAWRGGLGALDYAWQDDCYTGVDGEPLGPGVLTVPYPAPADRADPTAKFTVSARWYCPPFWDPVDGWQFCSPTVAQGTVQIKHGPFRHPPNSDPKIETQGAEHTTTVYLPQDVWIDVAEFDALGHCTSLVDGFDCGR